MSLRTALASFDGRAPCFASRNVPVECEMAASALPTLPGPRNSALDRTHFPGNPSSLHCLTLDGGQLLRSGEILKAATAKPPSPRNIRLEKSGRPARSAAELRDYLNSWQWDEVSGVIIL